MRLGGILVEGMDGRRVPAQQIRTLRHRTVSQAEPEEFRRRAQQQAALLKVGILGNDHEAPRLCVVPYDRVIGLLQSDFPDMNAGSGSI